MSELWEKPREYVEVRQPINRKHLGYSILLGVIVALVFALFLKVYADNQVHQRHLKQAKAEADYMSCLGMAGKNSEVEKVSACMRWGYEDGMCNLGIADTYRIDANFKKFKEDCTRRFEETTTEVWE